MAAKINFYFIFMQIFILYCGVIKAHENSGHYDRHTNATENCPEMKEWDSLVPTQSFYVTFPAHYIVIHHTMGVNCLNTKICETIVKNIQTYSMKVKNYPDIKYNFLIGEDGNIYQGSGWFRKGFHSTDDYNSVSISIAFIGDFTIRTPNSKALNAAKNLIKCGAAESYIRKDYKIVGALQLSKETKSPGLALYNKIQNWDSYSKTL